jgi:membrane protease YdiL (CAAX protease family)
MTLPTPSSPMGSPPPPLCPIRAGGAWLVLLVYYGGQVFSGAAITILIAVALNFQHAVAKEGRFNLHEWLAWIIPWAALGGLLIGSVLGIALALLIGRRSLLAQDPDGVGLSSCRWITVVRAATVGLGFAAAYLALATWVFPPREDAGLGPLASMAMAGGWQRLVWIFIALVLAPPIEEFIFRGVFYSGLRRSWGTAVASSLTIGIFVALHLPEAWDFPLAIISIALGAAALLMLRHRTGSIFPGLGAHLAYNFMLGIYVLGLAVVQTGDPLASLLPPAPGIHREEARSEEAHVVAAAQKMEMPVLEHVDSPGDAEARKIGQEGLQLLKKKDWDGLEAMAESLRASGETNWQGHLLLWDFYHAISQVPRHEDDPIWEARIRLLEAWRAAKPDSIAPRVALGKLYTDYAWKARGGGWSRSVSENGWKLFRYRLGLARAAMLDGLNDFPANDPSWFSQLQTVALGQGWGQEEYDLYYHQARKAFPRYSFHVGRRAYHLLPRWHGEPGDSGACIAEAADKAGGEEGDALYARAACYLYTRVIQDDFWGDTGLDWRRVDRGLTLLEAQHGDDPMLLGIWAQLACDADDRIKARELFRQLDGRVSGDAWFGKKGKSRFQLYWSKAHYQEKAAAP